MTPQRGGRRRAGKLALLAALAAAVSGCGTPGGGTERVAVRSEPVVVPVVSPEIELGRRRSTADWGPAGVWGGGQFLLTWVEELANGTRSIRATRMLADGTQLDPDSFVVASEVTDSLCLVSDDTSYLVAGADGQRVFLDASVVSAPFISRDCNAAWDGTSYRSVWEEPYMFGEDCFLHPVVGRRFASDGSRIEAFTVLDDMRCDWHTGPMFRLPDIAFGGRTFLVVWNFYSSLEQALLASDGTVTPLPNLADSVGAYPNAEGHELADVAWGDTAFLVAWKSTVYADAAPRESILRVARVLSDGTVLDPGGLTVTTTGASIGNAALTYDGATFVAAWTDLAGSADVRAARVTGDGMVLDPGGFPVANSSDDETLSALASDGAGTTLVGYRRDGALVGAARARARLLRFADDGTRPADAGAGGAGGAASGGTGGVAGAGGAGGAATGGGGAGASGAGGGSAGTAAAGARGGGAGQPASDAGASDATTGSDLGRGAAGDDAGCGCRLAPDASARGVWLLALVPALLLGRRRAGTSRSSRRRKRRWRGRSARCG